MCVCVCVCVCVQRERERERERERGDGNQFLSYQVEDQLGRMEKRRVGTAMTSEAGS